MTWRDRHHSCCLGPHVAHTSSPTSVIRSLYFNSFWPTSELELRRCGLYWQRGVVHPVYGTQKFLIFAIFFVLPFENMDVGGECPRQLPKPSLDSQWKKGESQRGALRRRGKGAVGQQVRSDGEGCWKRVCKEVDGVKGWEGVTRSLCQDVKERAWKEESMEYSTATER